MRHEFRTLSDLYDYASAKYARRTAASFTDGQQKYTFAQFRETCDNLSRTLSNFGIGAFDKVGILSENMPHWSIAFFACAAYGRVAVPMLNELSSSEVDNILEHSGTKALFISRRQLKKLSDKALEIYNDLKKDFMIDFDETGSIGKRYRRQDEIGTPLCVTYDFDSEQDGCVTVRDRDTMEQVRIPIAELKAYIAEKIAY